MYLFVLIITVCLFKQKYYLLLRKLCHCSNVFLFAVCVWTPMFGHPWVQAVLNLASIEVSLSVMYSYFYNIVVYVYM